MRKFEKTNFVYPSVFEKEMDRTFQAVSDIHRILPEVLDDLSITHDRDWYLSPSNVVSIHRYYFLPTLNHDPETHNLYEYDLERDRIVINYEVIHVGTDRVFYRVLYRAVAERRFTWELMQKMQRAGLSSFLNKKAAFDMDRPWLPGLAKYEQTLAECKVPAEEVFSWRKQYAKYLIWNDPAKVTVRRALMFVVEKERCEERAYRMAKNPDLFEVQEDS